MLISEMEIIKMTEKERIAERARERIVNVLLSVAICVAGISLYTLLTAVSK